MGLCGRNDEKLPLRFGWHIDGKLRFGLDCSPLKTVPSPRVRLEHRMYTWILGIAGVCIVLAFLVHFLMPAKGAKIPAILLGTVGGFAAGVVCGLLGAVMYGETVQKQVYGDMYLPGPMPSVSSPPANAGAPPAPKAETGGGGGTPVNAGPGSTSLRSDYPGLKERNEGRSKGSQPTDGSRP